MLIDETTLGCGGLGLMKEVLEEFVEAASLCVDKEEIFELTMHEWVADRRRHQAEAKEDARLIRRIKKLATDDVVCPWCLEKFTVIEGLKGRPRKWHTDRCRMRVLRETDRVRCSENEEPSSV